MSKDLLQEALADIDSLTKAAEENAVHAVVEAVTPRIRKLIESRMINLDDDSENVEHQIDESNKKCESEVNYTLDEETVKKIVPIVNLIEKSDELTVESILNDLSNRVDSIVNLNEENKRDYEQFGIVVTSVENMYEYVRKNIDNEEKRTMFEGQLNKLYEKMKVAEEIEESQMAKKLNEEDLTLKLSGLPELEDEDLENVEVELVADETEEVEVGDDEFDVVGDEESSDEEDEFDLSGFGGDEEEEEDEFKGESTVYEIDETILAAELALMKEVDQCCIDDFGGGNDEGDPWLDSDLPNVPGTKECCSGTVTEGDDMDDEDVDEKEKAEVCSKKEGCNEVESKLQTEEKISNNIRRRLRSIKEQYKKSKNEVTKKRLREAFKRNNARLVESVKRAKTLKESLSRSNNGKGQRAGSDAVLVSSLRKKLAESNLDKLKLLQAVKVLQENSLTSQQKKRILEAIQKAKTASEVKELNERVSKVVKRSASPMNESKSRGGLASSPMKSSGQSNKEPLNENMATNRWQVLAGLDK